MEREDVVKESAHRLGRTFTYASMGLAIAVILATSAVVYAVSAGYENVYDDANLDVDLRIVKVNPNPKNFAIVLASVRMRNLSPSDIVVQLFSVKAFNGPDRTMKYGEDAATNLLIPAHSVLVKNFNVKVQNYTYLIQDEDVFVQTLIQWTHFGTTYERVDARLVAGDWMQFRWMLFP